MFRDAPCSPLITLDVGGVVVRICPSIEQAAARARVSLRPPRHPAREAQVQHLLVEWQEGRLDDDAFFPLWTDAIGARCSVEEARAISAAWIGEEFSGIRELLDELHELKLPLGCLSNTCAHHWQLLFDSDGRFPAMRRFHHRHASHLLGVMKPHADAFEKYERAVGASGSAIVFFDDALENVQAAQRRGWRATQVHPAEGPARQIRATLRSLGLLAG